MPFCLYSGFRSVWVFDCTVVTYESQYTLREGQYARIEQETEAIGPMFQGKHVYH